MKVIFSEFSKFELEDAVDYFIMNLNNRGWVNGLKMT